MLFLYLYQTFLEIPCECKVSNKEEKKIEKKNFEITFTCRSKGVYSMSGKGCSNKIPHKINFVHNRQFI